jgi:hypothetical protein
MTTPPARFLDHGAAGIRSGRFFRCETAPLRYPHAGDARRLAAWFLGAGPRKSKPHRRTAHDPLFSGRWLPRVVGSAAADPVQTFKQGQRFRVRLEAFCDLYVYVLNKNADGTAVVLLPEKTEKVPLVKRGQSALLPDDGSAFSFSPPSGTETLRVIAAPVELPWVASAELFKLQAGQELTAQESSVLDQIKGLRARGASAKSIEDAKLTKVTGTATAPQAKSAASVQGAIKAIGEGKRSRQLIVEAATGNSKGLLVTHASPDPESKAILVYEIALKHDK